MASQQEIVIIGGGLMGLAIAWELRQAGATVQVLSRDFKAAAGHAAAGMLAPEAEQLPRDSALFQLAIQSRELYPTWIQALESCTGSSTDYWPCGILAPVYDSGTIPQPESSLPATWLTPDELHHRYPGFSDQVIGAYWYPRDAQVDSRALMQALWLACRQSGVDIVEGVAVEMIHSHCDRITSLQTSQGMVVADHYILATGAWSQTLLPVPVSPRKGQMLALQTPAAPVQGGLPLQTVIFAPDIYIVPRQSGRIILGATSEDVGFLPENTAAGIHSLLRAAVHLFPALKDCPIQELWWGYRPTASDELPIIGASTYENLTLATGHHRNGILLAPITAQLIRDWVLDQHQSPLLSAFRFDRC